MARRIAPRARGRSTARSARTAAGLGGSRPPTSQGGPRAHGGTVNDVVLAVITGGFRDLLPPAACRRGHRGPDDGAGISPERGREGLAQQPRQRVFLDLPVGLADPVARLTNIRRQMDGLKESERAVGGDALVKLAGWAPPTLLALGTRLGGRLPQNTVNTITTNVPGPQIPLYIAGRQMIEAYPFVPIQGNVRISIAIFHLGQLNFGVTGDYDSAPDIGVLCSAIGAGVTEYLDIARRTRGRGKPGAGRVEKRTGARRLAANTKASRLRATATRS